MPSEKTVDVQLSHIIDPTVLRALGIINNEDEIESYSIQGSSLVPLKIKFKRQEVEVIHHNGGT